MKQRGSRDLSLSAHHPVEVPTVGKAVQLVFAAISHGRIFALAFPAGKLDVLSVETRF